MEDDPPKKIMENDLKKRKKEDDLKKITNGKQPKKKWKTNQSTKINLIGCDTNVNSPSQTICGIPYIQVCVNWKLEKLKNIDIYASF